MVVSDGAANKYVFYFVLEEGAVMKEEKREMRHEINNTPEYFTYQQ